MPAFSTPFWASNRLRPFIGLIYDTLQYYDPEKDLQPGLADEWSFGDPRTISWGKLIAQAQSGGALLFGSWWWVVFPGATPFVTALGSMLVGLALEEAFNPCLKEGSTRR